MWRLRGIEGLNPGQQAFLATIADLLHNKWSTEFLIMVFFMVLTLKATVKFALLLVFRGLFTIEWE